jgi:hypothetical protein
LHTRDSHHSPHSKLRAIEQLCKSDGWKDGAAKREQITKIL